MKVNDKNCNMILNMLKEDFPFLQESESTCLQQSQRDLKNAFQRFYTPNLKSDYPQHKTKKNKDSFRIINNKNTLRLEKNKYGTYKLRLPKLGLIKFKTSTEYKELLLKGSDPHDKTVKIKHTTIKKEHDKYYAVINIECIHTPIPKKNNKKIGADIGCSKLVVLSTKQEINNLDLTKETNKITHYSKKMSIYQKGSNRYNEAKRLYNKWWEKLLNKREDYYDKETRKIVENASFISVQNENIKAWFHNKHLSKKLQLNAPRSFMDKLEYKSKWNNVEFIKIPKNFPSTQLCSNCQEKNKTLKGLDKLKIRDWICQNAEHTIIVTSMPQ